MTPLPSLDEPTPVDDEVRRIASRFASNSGVLLLSYGLNTLLSAVVAVFLVRYLGGEEYGLLTTTYAYISFFQIFTSVGIDTLVQRDVARAPHRAAEIVADAVGLRLALSALSMVLAWVLLPLTDPSARLALLVVVATLTFPFSFQGLYLVRYAAELRQGFPKLVLGIWSIALSALKLGMIGLRAPLEAFVVLEVVSSAAVFAVSVRLGRRGGLALRARWAPAHWRALLAASWPVAAATTFIQVYLRVDQLMLYRMLGAVEVGLYGVAVRVVEFGNVIPIVFVGSAFPLLSRLHEGPGDRLERATGLSYRFLAWLSLPGAALLAWYADPLVPLVFGEEFRPSAAIMGILAWSLPFAFANSIFYNRLFASAQQRTAAGVAGVAAAVNVVLNLILIPTWAGRGAAAATVASYGCVLPLALAVPGVRAVAVQGLRTLVRPGLAALGALGVLAALEPGPWVGTGLFALAYAGLLALVREVGREEVALLRRIAGGRA